MKQTILSISLFALAVGSAMFITSCSKDDTPPVVTLLGSATETITLGDTFFDLGAAANDDKDGSVSVTTSGTVDESTEGTYTLTYTASDKEGNTGTATRTVIVEITRDNYIAYYNVTSPCVSDYSANIGYGSVSDGIVINNLGDAGINITATVSGHDITIPSQTFFG
ncbi:MAG: DUF5011 domain-containing protein, partial [Bacteroidota bacterium]